MNDWGHSLESAASEVPEDLFSQMYGDSYIDTGSVNDQKDRMKVSNAFIDMYTFFPNKK